MSIQIPVPVRPTSVARVPSSSAKAGPVGPGAGVLMTEFTLSSVMGRTPQDLMQKYMRMGIDVDWIRACERIIGGRIASCKWHIEDPDEETIDEEYENPRAVELLHVLQNPQADLPLVGPDGVGKRQSRRQQILLTSRHMGTAGTGAWFFDRLDGNGVPHAVLYIRPDRLFPEYNKRGVLVGWFLDKKPGDPGIPLPMDQVQLFQLSPPDVGVFGPGLVESSLSKAINSGLVDKHYTSLLRSGGRLSGILAPKEGSIDDDNVFEQMVRDWRNVTEQPEAARRLQIVRAPVEFTPTVQSVGEMAIIELILTNRDALLALWGVPLSMLGGATSSGGLNSGDSRQYDEAALWQGPVDDRLGEFTEGYQALCDRWEQYIGFRPKFVFDKPTFDDDSPNFEKLVKAHGTPLMNFERRAIIGLDPFGNESLDRAIWMPTNVVAMAMGTDDNGDIVTGEIPGIRAVTTQGIRVDVQPGTDAVHTPAVDPAKQGAPGPAAGVPASARSAQKGSLSDLREEWYGRVVPLLTDATGEFLKEQRDAVVSAVIKNWEAIKRHGGTDESMWMPDPAKWDERLMGTLRPALQGMAAAVEADISSRFGRSGKAGPQATAYALGEADTGAVMHVLTRGAGRVTQVNNWTRENLRRLIGDSIEKGLSPREAGDVVGAWSGFDEYRAERIARTEMMFSYNASALSTYGQYGVTHVQAIDGDKDEQCAERDGKVYSILDADGIMDHPNGTLDWLPVTEAF